VWKIRLWKGLWVLEIFNGHHISDTKSEYYKSDNSVGWKTKRGDIYMLCPFHREKTPSCVVSATRPRYFICYGCGKAGGIRELCMEYRWFEKYKYNQPSSDDQLMLDLFDIPF
jgi:hypothetical protein